MKRKGWFIPILFFILSITGLVFYQKRQDSESFATPTTLPPILWSESSRAIHKITFEEGQNNIEVVRESDFWRLHQPLNTPADNLLIYKILLSFREPSLTEVIEVNPLHLNDYGIHDFSPRITIYTTDQEVYELIRGDLSDSSHYYVYSPMAHTIYTMSKYHFDILQTDISAWRDKSLLSFDKENIASITLDIAQNTYKITPSTKDSEIIFEAEGLDEKTLNQFIDFLQVCKINHFITDLADPHLLKSYGFDSPSLRVLITLKSGEQLHILIGNILKQENICYTIINHSKSILAIPYFNLENLKSKNT